MQARLDSTHRAQRVADRGGRPRAGGSGPRVVARVGPDALRVHWKRACRDGVLVVGGGGGREGEGGEGKGRERGKGGGGREGEGKARDRALSEGIAQDGARPRMWGGTEVGRGGGAGRGKERGGPGGGSGAGRGRERARRAGGAVERAWLRLGTGWVGHRGWGGGEGIWRADGAACAARYGRAGGLWAHLDDVMQRGFSKRILHHSPRTQ